MYAERGLIAGNAQLNPKIRVLTELRPALGGHAGIPQAARLLFSSLCRLDSLEVEGLIQSSRLPLMRGLPGRASARHKPLPPDQEIHRLGRVVISLERETADYHIRATAGTIAMLFKHVCGGQQRLTHFPASRFRDFVWRRFFERTLPSDDIEAVTSADFRIARVPWGAMHIAALVTRKLGWCVYPRLDTSGFDVMISETPYPGTVASNTQLIVRYHDAIPLLMPHTISDRRWHQAFHYHALRKNVVSGAWFVCVSEATRADLLTIFPQLEDRSVTIPNMVSHEYFEEDSSAARVPEIIKTHLSAELNPPLDPRVKRALFAALPPPPRIPSEYLLIVSTLEPRKNHLNLVAAWERLRIERSSHLKLIVVGALGWHHEPIIGQLRPWLERGEAFLLADVPASELRVLYRHAAATICPSFSEGFGFSGVEAMKSGGAVVASDLPVHREIYRDAAEFFNPYDIGDVVRGICAVIDPFQAARRSELAIRGAAVAALYDRAVIAPKWDAFLHTLTKAAK